MKLRRIYVYGAGGHGKVVADLLLAAGLPVIGFVDDCPSRLGSTVLDFLVAGNGEWLRAKESREAVAVALGIGDNRARQDVAERCRSWGFEIATAIHPRATVSSSAVTGAGTVVMAGAVINADARLGLGVIVNTGAVVEHDCLLGDYAHLSPNAALGGAARLGPLSHVGLGAVVLPGVAVGSETIIGAGAVVVRNIPERVVATGVPARVQPQAGIQGA